MNVAADPVAADPIAVMDGMGLNVYGHLIWSGGDVYQGTVGSVLYIDPTGDFTIQSVANTWGKGIGAGNPIPSRMTIANWGTVTLNSQNHATIVGNYTTHGKTELKNGTLALTGLAEQKAGTFFLYPNTSVHLNPPVQGVGGVLSIRDGALRGYGAVDGNLDIGYPVVPQGLTPNPIIAPTAVDASNNGSGVIQVTGNLRMFGGNIQIFISGPGVFDRVHVSGSATLSGIAVGALYAVHSQIPANTQFPFLTYGSRTNDFASKIYPGVNWTSDKNNTTYWFYPTVGIPASAPGRIGGRLWQDYRCSGRGV